MTAGMQPQWAEWIESDEPFSVGIEEEVMLLDPGDWALDHDFEELRPRLSADLEARLSAETHGSAMEYGSAPHASAGDAEADVGALRRQLAGELAGEGRAVAASGTHPFATWQEIEIAAAPRPRYLHETMRELARREPTFALHVHVAVPSAEEAIVAFNRIRAHLPVLLALAANSPFWQGRDTAMASARTPIFQTFPRVGLPRRFDGYRDYVETLETMIRCGAFPEPNYVWWDMRLQPRFGTLEVRVMDAQSDSGRIAPLAALTQALVRLEVCEGHAPVELLSAPELLSENRFLAARDGIAAELLDPVAGRRVAVTQQLEALLAACADHARDLACEAELGRVAELVERPGHWIQRELAGPDLDLAALVAELSRRFLSPAREASDRPRERSAAPQR